MIKIKEFEQKIFIIIFFIILSFIVFISNDMYEKYRQKKAVQQIHIISDAVLNYFRDNNKYPSEEQGLRILFEKPLNNSMPNWDGPYLIEKILKDPWGNEFVYHYPGKINKLGFDIRMVNSVR